MKDNLIIEIYSYDEWLQKLKDTLGICPKCKRYIGIDKLEMDHIYPVFLAYKNYIKELALENYEAFPMVYTLEDVQPLCKTCNSSKGFYIDYSSKKEEMGTLLNYI